MRIVLAAAVWALWAPAAQALSPEALVDFLLKCPAQVELGCHGQAEQRLIAQQPPGRVTREAGRLGIRRQKGQVLFLEDRLDAAASAVRYVYLGELGLTDVHVVRTLGAGSAHPLLLVPESAQAPLTADAVPWPAPGGRLMVVVSDHEVVVWQRTALRWTLAFRFEPPPGVSMAYKGWRGDAGAVNLDWRFKPELAHVACSGPAQGQAQLRDGPYGWEWVPALPIRC